ncbi:hypothetical protein R9X47_16985 [Wukongibacter baidiensis]|uniref:hypothetical protein n=1 Tax=Wukongibacter baidiensis TaxID=1723361 RepID=UPI003D7F9DB4
MSPILKQTVKNKNISFWKILAMIIISVIVTNIATDIFSRYGASFGSLAALGALLLCSTICGRIIYKNLAYYNYRIIEDELMVERVIGRANHIFFHIKPKDIKYIKPYKELNDHDKEIREYKFVTGNNKNNWYVVEFLKDGRLCRVILEPNEAFLSALNRNLEKIEENKGLSHKDIS